ncbi:hypothetical protein WJN01_15430, partial [Flavobacteriaceae bacterium SZ-1-7]|uniref:hypothetical protein n=1 Tax=Tamlana sedimenti TaxID=3134126 RepID=UPI003122653A
TVQDLCETTNPTATYTFTQPDGISFTNPTGKVVNSCDFSVNDPIAGQNALDADIAAWVAAQTDVITNSLTGGSPDVTHDFVGQSIDLCAGGNITVTWTIDDICETINTTATYTVTPSDPIAYTAPTNLDAQSCDFTDQAGVDAAFNSWVANQTSLFAISGGCAPILSNDSASVSVPLLCDGGTATVTWTITDLCETINVSADFILTAPTAVTYSDPADLDAQSCDFADQAEVDTAFNNWVAAQSTAIAQAGGCSPVLSNDSASVSIPEFCTGGTATVTWTITDLCETINLSADFNLTAPSVVTYDTPVNLDTQSCDFADQAAVDTAFNNWVAAQSTAIAQAGGCSPVLSNDSASVTIPELCTGGTATVTWTITDLCETITNITASFNLTAPTAVTYSDPADLDAQSCDFADQAEVDTAFSNWVAAQSTAIAQASGCSPVLSNDSTSVTIPELCTGGTVTVTWTITDLCETINLSADFNLTAPSVVTYDTPANLNAQSCDFTDQGEVDTAFSNWVAAQSTAIAQSGGCSPVLSNDSATVTIPELCTGGTATVTWTITDLCETINLSADFNLTAPQTLEHQEPTGKTANTCDFYDIDPNIAQAALDNDIAAWVAEQTNITTSTFIGGCSPTSTHDFTNQSIDLCSGGSLTITWTVNDLCEVHTHEATYTLVAPQPVTYNNPQDDASSAAEFDDPDANVAQANLDADIAAWVAAQTDNITNNISGGCNPTITNDFVDQSISFCATGSITITWTVEDLCETTNPTATYTFTQPDGINFNNPSAKDVNSCDFDNDNPVVAQNDLDADIAAWVSAQTDIITNSLTGGSPEVTHDFVGQSIDLCNGGNVTVTWFIDDICENINTSATYTVTPPAAVTYSDPADLDAQSCDFADQAEVDTAFNNWVTNQTSLINITGGCNPILSNDSATVTIPELCTGGTATVTWTITDLCETINVSADFNLTAPAAVTYNDPADLDAQSCDFADQTEVDTAFSNWVNAQSTAIAQAGGCSPVLSNDSASVSIPELCTGGTATVTWTITDLCETINVSADFNLTAPTAVTYSDPADLDAQSCDFADQAEVDTAFNNWVAAQSTAIAQAGGCSPVLSNDSATVTIPELCTGGTATVTWTITDLCETINLSADFNLTAP